MSQAAQDLGELREATVTLLRERELAVDHDVELALLALGHLGDVPGAVQLGHETRGPFVVAVSDGAVEDADVRHRVELNDRPPLGS